MNIINYDGDLSSNREVDCTINQNKIPSTTDTESTKFTTRTSAIDVPATESEVQDGVSTAVQENEESIHDFIERTCVWCKRCRSVPSEDRAVLEFVIRSPGIWLHALQYSFAINTALNDGNEDDGKNIVKSFRTNLPDWHDF